jgi:hypothetical protein
LPRVVLSLHYLIAMTDLKVTGPDQALGALRRVGSDGAVASSGRPASCSRSSATSVSADW